MTKDDYIQKLMDIQELCSYVLKIEPDDTVHKVAQATLKPLAEQILAIIRA